MSWNITTFILFSRHFKFLATTTRPFLKYCINNAVIPLLFLVFYFFKAVQFDIYRELIPASEIFVLIGGFLLGLIFIIAVSFLYFFRADVNISRRIISVIPENQPFRAPFGQFIALTSGGSRLIKVTSYLDTPISVKAVRDVSHYPGSFIDSVFSRHHFVAVLSIFIAFIFLIIIGFLLDHPLFQIPAAASITIFFAILVAVAGAFSYFLQSWSVPFLVILILVLNLLYRYDIIDPSNKAYGIDYSKKKERAIYDRESLLKLCNPATVEKDKQQMLEVLENWKKKQKGAKPLLYMICVSGGGTRSADFTMNIMQRLDSLSGGELMNKTFLISGASGGMLGAAYFRGLFQEKISGRNINLQDKKYADDISKDLLNPTLSSFVARDLASPAQKFTVGEYSYIKDRGYAFEQKLNYNTNFILDKQIKDLYEPEHSAKVPLILFNSVITRDGRKMLISSQPMSFLMQPSNDTTDLDGGDPDMVDFSALFAKQDPMNLRMLTALRMNATFPYILPNVWLPSSPVIDVMDAGLRDNFGQEVALRFAHVFKDWILENTSGVVLLQIRDRKGGGWEFPFESAHISEVVTKPMLLLQYNWHKMQQYNQNELVSLSRAVLNNQFHKIVFQYVPKQENSKAALNFHLTRREKKDITEALDNETNSIAYDRFTNLLQYTPPAPAVSAKK